VYEGTKLNRTELKVRFNLVVALHTPKR